MAETFHMVNVDVTTSDPTVLTAGGGETLVILVAKSQICTLPRLAG